MIWNYFWIAWIVSSLALLRLYFFAVAYKAKLVSKPTKDRFGTPRLIFQITTKGNIPIVQATIDRVNSVCKEIEYKKYEVWVVTDVQEEFANCRTIVVPKDYSCNAVYKGRALQYAVETRKKEKKNTEDLYVFHLDDESLITKQTLCSILTFLENNPPPISEGLIIYPLQEKEKIRITHLLDTLRPFCCFECLDFMKRGNPAYIHGSNLLIRNDIEEEVGWENGRTIAEDSLFALKARSKCGSAVFGWHGGVIEERSPFDLKDFFKQRKRWYYGLVQNLQYLSVKNKILQLIRAMIWSFGFISGLVSILALVYPQDMLIYFRVVFLVTTLLWLCSYQIGAFMNSKYLSFRRRVFFHSLILLS